LGRERGNSISKCGRGKRQWNGKKDEAKQKSEYVPYFLKLKSAFKKKATRFKKKKKNEG